jgi:hypothetical protein
MSDHKYRAIILALSEYINYPFPKSNEIWVCERTDKKMFHACKSSHKSISEIKGACVECNKVYMSCQSCWSNRLWMQGYQALKYSDKYGHVVKCWMSGTNYLVCCDCGDVNSDTHTLKCAPDKRFQDVYACSMCRQYGQPQNLKDTHCVECYLDIKVCINCHTGYPELRDSLKCKVCSMIP